jgi:hypothetical protein
MIKLRHFIRQQDELIDAVNLVCVDTTENSYLIRHGYEQTIGQREIWRPVVARV